MILFLALGLIIGGTVKLLQLHGAAARYDFTESDAFFAEASSKIDSIIAAEEDTSANARGAHAAGSKFVDFPVNINTADIAELTAIPGVGKVIATRIVDYRNLHGKFNRLEELRNVKGIGEKKFAKIRQHVKAD